MVDEAATISIPVAANPIAAFLNGLVKAAIGGGEKGLEVYATTQVPALGLPIISIIFDDAVELVGDNINETIADIIDMLVNEVQVNAQNSSLVSASRARIAAKATNDPQKIAAATAAAIAAYQRLGHFDGA